MTCKACASIAVGTIPLIQDCRCFDQVRFVLRPPRANLANHRCNNGQQLLHVVELEKHDTYARLLNGDVQLRASLVVVPESRGTVKQRTH
jgi:homospermidine synthase